MKTSARWASSWMLLGGSVLVGFVGVLGSTLYGKVATERPKAQERVAAVPVRRLTARIDLAPQLPQQSMAGLRDRGYTAVIDLRPDGEDAKEPQSADMAEEAKASGIKFRYVPVPHGDIPDAAVDRLRQALAESQGEQVLLYCRSGRRAARTWALVESGKAGGLAVPQILEVVKAAGQDASDLRERLEANVLRRGADRSGS